jgi:hypothetical protein
MYSISLLAWLSDFVGDPSSARTAGGLDVEGINGNSGFTPTKRNYHYNSCFKKER